MSVPTITGRIRLPDDSAFVGTFAFLRKSGPMFNGTTCVHLAPVIVTTDSDGDFETPLHPGQYIVDCIRSKYRGPVVTQFTVRVPNSSSTINFSDLEIEGPALPDPSFFGGSSGGGGSVSAATTTDAGIVKINVTDAAPVAVTKKSLDGSSGLGVIFKPIDGSIWLQVSNGNYAKLTATVLQGQNVLGISQTTVAFASLPSA